MRGANEALLEQLRPTLGGRTILYAGIDCHTFLPALVAELGGAPVPRSGTDLPVMDDAELVGRRTQRNELLAAFERGQAVQIIGPRRMGKSSLLRWMERKAKEMGKRAAFVNARGLAGRSPADLVMAAAEAVGKRDAAKEVLYAERAVPDATDAARALETLAPVFLLVVDEADALAEPGHGFDKGFFDALRALGQDRKIQWVSASRRDLFDQFVLTGLTSAFLNDARKIHVGAMSRTDAEMLLRKYVVDAFRVWFAWEVAGGFAPLLKWVGQKLAAADADPGAVEKGLAVWVRPLLAQWWAGCGGEERAVLKRAVGEGLEAGEMGDKERRVAVGLARSGFLVEGEGGRMVLGGRVWREFVRGWVRGRDGEGRGRIRGAPLPAVPGVLRLGWLLFMQPKKLRQMFAAWRIEGDLSLWSLRHQLRARDPVVTNMLVRRLAARASTLSNAVARHHVGEFPAGGPGCPRPMGEVVAFGLAFGVALGLAASVVRGVTGGAGLRCGGQA